MILLKTVFLVSGVFFISCGDISSANETQTGNIENNQKPRNFSDPSQGRNEQALGFYSDGKIKNSDSIGWEGPGFVKIFRPRERQYGTHDMIYVLDYAAKKMQQIFRSSDRLMIGDLSNERGGFAWGHNSHQNGLDADIAFIRKDKTEQDPNKIDGWEEKFVKRGRLTKNFDLARNWTLAKVLVSTERVDRIFANTAVKKGLCRYAKKIGEYSSYAHVLRKIAPHQTHMDHYHVRLNCPLNSPRCKPQKPLPPGTGC